MYLLYQEDESGEESEGAENEDKKRGLSLFFYFFR